MKQNFTKNDLMTGDIIEDRDGRRGIYISDKDYIVYRDGRMYEMDVFTDDLFEAGLERSEDIFRVYRDYDIPFGFDDCTEDLIAFERKNDKRTKAREKELNELYNPRRGKFRAIILTNGIRRRCHKTYLDPNEQHEVSGNKRNSQGTVQMVGDIDIAMSEAPSMTACGQIGIDRTLVRVPGTDNVFFMYNQYQEKWHLQLDEESFYRRDKDPIVVIPEEKVRIHSNCLLVRMNDSGELEHLIKEDYDVAKKYMHEMEML